MTSQAANLRSFEAWNASRCEILDPPPPEVLAEACNGIPVRIPGGHGTNIVSFIPSRKMNTMMLSESRSLEMKACFLQELYRPVLAYYSQPYRFNLLRVDVNGILKSTPYTPDYLSIVSSELNNHHYILIECKKVSSMLSKPQRFKRKDGRWIDVEAEPQLKELGFHLSVFSDEDTTPILKKNLSLLMPQARAAAQAEQQKRRTA